MHEDPRDWYVLKGPLEFEDSKYWEKKFGYRCDTPYSLVEAEEDLAQVETNLITLR